MRTRLGEIALVLLMFLVCPLYILLNEMAGLPSGQSTRYPWLVWLAGAVNLWPYWTGLLGLVIVLVVLAVRWLWRRAPTNEMRRREK